jgi:hypothetical protein
MKLTSFNSSFATSLVACALAIGSLASARPAMAQDTSVMKATIPFDFQAGSERMPAGQYEIDKLSGAVILLRGPAAHTSEFLIVHSAEVSQPPNHSSLIFTRYGDRYFLHQVWTAGETNGQECPTSRAEKEVERASNKPAPTQVELALNGPQR